jgi:hypothetical protein
MGEPPAWELGGELIYFHRIKSIELRERNVSQILGLGRFHC